MSRFRCPLDGRQFHILTDHKPLTQALHRVSDPWTDRAQHQLSFLAELTLDVRHIVRKANIVAYALSWLPPSAVAGIKEPTGSIATSLQGGKLESSPPSASMPAAIMQVTQRTCPEAQAAIANSSFVWKMSYQIAVLCRGLPEMCQE